MSLIDRIKRALLRAIGKTNTPVAQAKPMPRGTKEEQITLHLFPDDYHLTRLGVLPSGDQFIIDINLIFKDGQTRDFVSTYLFWANGALKNYTIEEVGIRGDIPEDHFKEIAAKHLEQLGEHTIAPIKFEPFTVPFSGVCFGYSVRKNEAGNSKDVDFFVDVLPGHTLMFHPPWEEGAYAT